MINSEVAYFYNIRGRKYHFIGTNVLLALYALAFFLASQKCGAAPPENDGVAVPEGITILKAYYGSQVQYDNGKERDVTEKAKQYVVDGKLYIKHTRLAFGDPHPRKAKLLRISYLLYGKHAPSGKPWEFEHRNGEITLEPVLSDSDLEYFDDIIRELVDVDMLEDALKIEERVETKNIEGGCTGDELLTSFKVTIDKNKIPTTEHLSIKIIPFFETAYSLIVNPDGSFLEKSDGSPDTRKLDPPELSLEAEGSRHSHEDLRYKSFTFEGKRSIDIEDFVKTYRFTCHGCKISGYYKSWACEVYCKDMLVLRIYADEDKPLAERMRSLLGN